MGRSHPCGHLPTVHANGSVPHRRVVRDRILDMTPRSLSWFHATFAAPSLPITHRSVACAGPVARRRTSHGRNSRIRSDLRTPRTLAAVIRLIGATGRQLVDDPIPVHVPPRFLGSVEQPRPIRPCPPTSWRIRLVTRQRPAILTGDSATSSVFSLRSPLRIALQHLCGDVCLAGAALQRVRADPPILGSPVPASR